MKRAEMIEKINAIIVDVAECDAARLKPTATLIDLGFDSLTLIETAEALEEELDVKFEDEDLQKEVLRNLGDVYALAWERLPHKTVDADPDEEIDI